MTKAVLDTRAGSGYDDDITTRYHFPNRYLPVARGCLNDWVLFRDPARRGRRGSSGYTSVARVIGIDPDPASSSHSYAIMSDFLSFDSPVPLDGPEGAYESLLQAVGKPSLRGVALQGKSMRAVSDAEFGAIAMAGLRETLDTRNALRLGLDTGQLDAATDEMLALIPQEQERRIEQILLNRRIRNASFRKVVMDAYDGRCAVTGIRIINGGGSAEAQVAHIWAVKDGGPDVVRNGIALSSTAHWLFDRHLITLTEDLGLLVSHNRVPAELRVLFNRQVGRVWLPQDPKLWPNPTYVARHRNAYSGKAGDY